ncbi:MAG: DUF4339 domain-containing protein [Planctomycetia bacterium]|nr:DUF4339 domain-containing protein [Planctomycetia bacterium]
MQDQWYVKKTSGQQFGPVTFAQLQQWVDQQQVTSTDWIQQAGDPAWKMASSVPALFGSPVVPAIESKHRPRPGTPPGSYSALPVTDDGGLPDFDNLPRPVARKSPDDSASQADFPDIDTTSQTPVRSRPASEPSPKKPKGASRLFKKMEVRATCNACGHVWHYLPGERVQEFGNRLSGVGSEMNKVGCTMLTCGCLSPFMSNPQRTSSLTTRCPKCNSSSISRETVRH